jgi:hypothetical protein
MVILDFLFLKNPVALLSKAYRIVSVNLTVFFVQTVFCWTCLNIYFPWCICVYVFAYVLWKPISSRCVSSYSLWCAVCIGFSVLLKLLHPVCGHVGYLAFFIQYRFMVCPLVLVLCCLLYARQLSTLLKFVSWHQLCYVIYMTYHILLAS